MDDITTHVTDTGRIDFLNVLDLEKVVTETMYRIPVDIIAKQKKSPHSLSCHPNTGTGLYQLPSNNHVYPSYRHPLNVTSRNFAIF